MTNAEKASALLESVRTLKPAPTPRANKLGLKFFDDIGPPLTLEQNKVLHLHRVLSELEWNIKNAAVVLAVGKRSLYRWIDQYDLKPGRTPAILERRV